MIPVTIHGLTPDENQEDYVLILNGRTSFGDGWLPILISPSEAQIMTVLLNDLESERPLSHDLLAELTDTLGGTVMEVRLETDRANELHGRFDVSKPGPGGTVTLRTTPSDAIALALRTGVEIMVDETVMNAEKPPPNGVSRDSHPSEDVVRLRRQLVTAVREGDFERALELKNEINDAIRKHEKRMEDFDEDVGARFQRASGDSRATEGHEEDLTE